MKAYILISALLVQMGWTSWMSAQTATEKTAETNWNAFQQALKSDRPVDAKAYVGKRVLFQGGLMDNITDQTHRLRPNPLRVGVARFDPAQGKYIGMGITCHVTLRKNEIKPVAGFVAGAVAVQVMGKITKFNPTIKTVAVRSEVTDVVYSD